MIALAALAAIGWGASDFFGGLPRSRLLVFAVVSLSELLGGALILPALMVTGLPHWNAHLLLACVAGIGGTVELGVVYYALSVGAAFITAPVGALGAAFAVGAGLVGGDRITPLIAAGLLCAVLGGGLSAVDDADEPGQLDLARTVAACLLAAVGVALTQISLHAAGKVNPYWAVEIEHLTTSATSAAVIAWVALRYKRRRQNLTRDRVIPRPEQLPLLAVVAICGAGGDVAFAAASSASLSTVSAIASLYPIPTISLAFAVQHRRIRRVQLTGIVVALAGAAVLGAVA